MGDSQNGGLGGGLRRMRWRLRGAWLWPTFVVATLVEMVLLHALPVQGDSTGWISALLAAGFLNLVAVVVVGGAGGMLLRRRRPDLPKVVADDYAGTAALAVVAVGLVVAGLAHRPEISERRALRAAQLEAVRRWIARYGDDYVSSHVSQADTAAVDENLFRTCVPTPDPKRWLCLIVDTTRSPPTVKRDPDREPNASFRPRRDFR